MGKKQITQTGLDILAVTDGIGAKWKEKHISTIVKFFEGNGDGEISIRELQALCKEIMETATEPDDTLLALLAKAFKDVMEVSQEIMNGLLAEHEKNNEVDEDIPFGDGTFLSVAEGGNLVKMGNER